MKVSVFSFALACLGSAANAVLAQYVPPTPRQAAVYQSPGQRNAGMAMPQAAPVPAAPSRGAIRTAQAPVRTAQAATPTNGFKPVNPVPQARQKVLLANNSAAVKSVPTAPRPGSPIPPSGSYAPPMNGQPWIPPTSSMPVGMPNGYSGGVEHAGPGGAAPVADEGSIDYGAGVSGCNDCGGGHGSCLAGVWHNGLFIPWKGPGDMAQHLPFFGTTHGYYYFRPYHVMHVFSQQELATRWGGDPRNPYDNSMFQRIYEQMGVEARPPVKPGVPVGTVPLNPDYTTPNEPATTPTPVPNFGYPVPAPGQRMPGAWSSPGAPAMSPPTEVVPLPSIEQMPATPR